MEHGRIARRRIWLQPQRLRESRRYSDRAKEGESYHPADVKHLGSVTVEVAEKVLLALSKADHPHIAAVRQSFIPPVAFLCHFTCASWAELMYSTNHAKQIGVARTKDRTR